MQNTSPRVRERANLPAGMTATASTDGGTCLDGTCLSTLARPAGYSLAAPAEAPATVPVRRDTRDGRSIDGAGLDYPAHGSRSFATRPSRLFRCDATAADRAWAVLSSSVR